MAHDLAAFGNAAEQGEDEAAHRVDLAPLVLGQHAADLLLEELDGRAAVDVDRAVDPARDRRGLGDVGLDVTFAHDVLDQTPAGEKPDGPAGLVDRQRHVSARAAHVEQHVEHRQGRRHEHYTAQYVAQVEFLRGAPVGQHVLDVDHADHIVERLAIDRIARMGLGLYKPHDLVERRVGGDGGDVDPGHHDVGYVLVAQLQDIGQEDALVFADRRVALGRLFDQLLDRLAHRLVLLAAPELA